MPNFILADATGRYCSYATGFAQASESSAFQATAADCRKLTGGADCFVYAADRLSLAGRTAW